jgi:hypothetical protein
VPLELVAPSAPQVLEDLAQSFDALAVAVPEPGLEHPAQGGVQIAVIQQVIGDLLEHPVGVELEADLRAVPPRIAEPTARRCHES